MSRRKGAARASKRIRSGSGAGEFADEPGDQEAGSIGDGAVIETIHFVKFNVGMAEVLERDREVFDRAVAEDQADRGLKEAAAS